MSQRLALIIGNSLYRDEKLTKLISPDADVGALKDALLDPELGGFDDVSLVFNSATHIVRREIYNFFAHKTSSDMLLFYFSGHGVLDENGKLYLAVKDTDTEALRGTAIPARYITEEMDNSRSKRQILILDCCHSGAFERGTKGSTGATVGTASAFEGSGYGRVILTASDATQYAWEGSQVIGDAENSLFTHFIIEGIKTGMADINQDGKITVDEIYDYTYSRIRDKTKKQTPGKWSFKEQGEMIISRSPINTPPGDVDQSPASTVSEQHLYKLYNEGLSAFLSGEWDTACQKFESFLETSPDFLDIEEKLVIAKKNKKNEDLYHRALEVYKAGNLSESIRLFQALQSQNPGFKDVAQRLAQLKFEGELSDLYSKAQTLYSQGYYEQVIEVFEKIHDLSPVYEDKEGILERAKNEDKRLKHTRLLEDLYRQAMLDLEANRLTQAENKLLKIQEMEKGYRATNQLLEQIRTLREEELYSRVKERVETDLKAEEERKRSTQSGQKFTQSYSTPLEVKKKPEKTYLKGFFIHLFTGTGLIYAKADTKVKWLYPISFFGGGALTIYLINDYYYYDLAPYPFYLALLIHFVGLVHTMRAINVWKKGRVGTSQGSTYRKQSEFKPETAGITSQKKSYFLGFLVHWLTGCGLFYAGAKTKWKWFFPINFFLGIPLANYLFDYYYYDEWIGYFSLLLTLVIQIVGFVITMRTIKKSKSR